MIPVLIIVGCLAFAGVITAMVCSYMEWDFFGEDEDVSNYDSDLIDDEWK